MEKKIWSVITGSGSYVPSVVVKNSDFLDHEFYSADGVRFDKSMPETIEKLKKAMSIFANELKSMDD